MSRLSICVIGAVALFLCSGAPAHASGNVFTPTRFDDPVPGNCADTDCSLREAIIAANVDAGEDSVYLLPGTYVLQQPISVGDTAQTGDLDVTSRIRLTGVGWSADITVIDANYVDRVFDIAASGFLIAEGISIEHGLAQPGYAGHAHGGGIHNHGFLLLEDSSITSNCAPAASAAGPWGGGGLTNAGSGSATLKNVTFVNNCTPTSSSSFGGYGGAIENGGLLQLFNVTIGLNSAPVAHGGAIANDVGFFGTSVGMVRLNNTIVGPETGGNCVGTITSSGYNLDSDGSCSLAGTGDISGKDPLFQTLLTNASGEFFLFTLQPQSPALDAGSGPYDPNTDTGCMPGDEVNATIRPQDGNDDGVPVCDIGAYENPDPPPLVNSVSPKAGATEVKASTNVSVAFNEPMNKAAAQAAFSLVRSDTSAAVAGTFAWNGNTMIFDPSSDLVRGRTYVARLTTAARDSQDVPLQSTKQWTFTIARLAAYPSSVVIGTGSLRDGDALRLRADDDAYYQVNSNASATPTSAWYGSFTGIPNGLGKLQAIYKGKNSASCNQALALYNFTTAAWRTIDTRAVGTTEVALKLDAPGTQADYVSGTSGSGEVRFRVKCEGTSPFYSSGDLMKITFAAP